LLDIPKKSDEEQVLTESCFNIIDVSFSYGGKKVIDRISQIIRKGSFYGILGPNGCGKTTFLDLIAGHKYPETGKFFLWGKQ
jgi:ABC-type Fe3+/spermidine/putrescine transport system ATPase subunit